MLTIAYIGNGKSANRYHLPFALKLKDQIKVKTIYSRSGRQNWQPIADVHYTTTLADIYEGPDIQLVVVSTPSHTHYSVAKDVLNHGKNVLVENHLRKHQRKPANFLNWLSKSICLFSVTRIGALIRTI